MKLLLGSVFLALILIAAAPIGAVISFMSLFFLILTPFATIYAVWFKPALFLK